jgi:hypothetical protein
MGFERKPAIRISALGDDGIDFLTFAGDPAILVALFAIFAQLMQATKYESRSNR